jgi:hypothetical protein
MREKREKKERGR